MKQYYNAILLAIIGGGFGLHKFYLGDKSAGILYAVFCWSGIPTLLAFIDMCILLFKTPEEFDRKYNSKCDSRVMSVFDRLKEIKDLFDNEAISEEEYIALKSKVLGEQI